MPGSGSSCINGVHASLQTTDNDQFFLCAAYIMLVTFYHSPYAASSFILASNDTQPPSPLLSEVDSGRGAGWEMRRCKRKRRRILSVALILRDASRNRRALRRVRDT